MQQQADQLKADMDALGGQAGDIGRILAVISDLAHQTSLLALNAVPKATRAVTDLSTQPGSSGTASCRSRSTRTRWSSP